MRGRGSNTLPRTHVTPTERFELPRAGPSGFRDHRHTGLGDVGNRTDRGGKRSKGDPYLPVSVNVQVHISWFPRSTGTTGPIQLDDAPDVTAMDLLDRLDVAPDSVLVVRGDTPIPLDARLHDGDTLRIVHTVSGG